MYIGAVPSNFGDLITHLYADAALLFEVSRLMQTRSSIFIIYYHQF